MIHNQIDTACMTQDNMIFIKQFGIKTKQHSKIGYSYPIPLPRIIVDLSNSMCTSKFSTHITVWGSAL